jgi:hypothetical protein
MIEYRGDEKQWYFNGKNINQCNNDELKAGYREFYRTKSKEELRTSLGFALYVENYLKCEIIKEVWGESYLEPIEAQETITNIVKKFIE